MHIFTTFTPSHQQFYDEFFLPSLQEHEPDIPITVRELVQTTSEGRYLADGWMDTIYQKFDQLWKFASALDRNELILCTDCDIQFFAPFAAELEEELRGFDLVCQTNLRNPDKFNIGFILFRWTPAVRAFLDMTMNSAKHFRQEEIAANYLLRHTPMSLRVKLLAPDRYWTILTTPERKYDPLLVPRDILMHHGNGVEGVENKLALMRQVREVVKSRIDLSSRLVV